MGATRERIGIRSAFAGIHLRASGQAALKAYRIQQKNPDVGPILPWVPISIVMAGAALEANVNELAQDIIESLNEPHVLGWVSAELRSRCSEGSKVLLEDLLRSRAGNAIDKHRQLALLVNKVPDTSKAVWQDAKHLVRLRNSLMHFKPAWDDEDDVHNSKLVKYLKARVSTWRGNPFMFPRNFMTYSCAKWCVSCVESFTDDFYKLIDTTHPRLRLKRPLP